MDPSDVGIIVILIILLILSAFFSSAETALTTSNKMRLRSLADDGDKRAKTVCQLIENPTKMLSTILICNNVVNLSASSLATAFAFRLCTELGMEKNASLAAGIATGILTILILIFGEITPKSIATVYADKLALSYSSVIYFITQLFTPAVYIVTKISIGLMYLCRVDFSRRPSQITEDELRTIVEVSHEEGVLESEERQMINNIVDFGDAMAKDVMVPRMDVDLVNVELTYNELLDAFSKEKYTRLPVYSETTDNIVGTISLKDIFFFHGNIENFILKDLMREPFFTYEYKRTAELFIEMRKEYTSMAIVLDEYGALAGIITLEDLVEEIVGEIRDEYDADEEDSIQCMSEYEYVVNGVTNLNDINDTLNLNIKKNDYDSIAGHIINLLQHFPDENETVGDEFAVYTVLAVDKNRIDKVHIHVKADHEDDKQTV